MTKGLWGGRTWAVSLRKSGECCEFLNRRFLFWSYSREGPFSRTCPTNEKYWARSGYNPFLIGCISGTFWKSQQYAKLIRSLGRHEDGPKKVVRQYVGQPPCTMWPKTCAIQPSLCTTKVGFLMLAPRAPLVALALHIYLHPRFAREVFRGFAHRHNSFRIKKGIHLNTKLVTKRQQSIRSSNGLSVLRPHQQTKKMHIIY